ncbi:roadblock/LC7 domain-containing protein [Streptomyces sp. NPDC097619]|uniref:roadblock/LC7 domain-containing protein n=1 Tax=Streptomyces sp. NPDC097619 TaxID=3157228 RepID=UPI00332A9971
MPGIDECLSEAMAVPGARGAALVDWSSGLALGTAGDSPVGDHEVTAAETAELARAAAEYESFAPNGATDGEPPGADGPPLEDVIVTTRSGYHILRFVETSFDSSIFLHLWLDRDSGNLALARIRLRELAGELVLR